MQATTDTALMPASTQKPRAKPLVAACAGECPDASSVVVCVNATVATIATPSAPPICCVALISPDASPACCGSTPASAAIDIGMLMCGLCSTMGHRAPGFDWRRHLELVIDVLRAR